MNGFSVIVPHPRREVKTGLTFRPLWVILEVRTKEGASVPDHRPTPLYLAWLLPLTVAFLSLGILLGRAADVWQPALMALLLGALAACLTRGWRRSAAMLLAASALGALLGWQAYHPLLPEERNYQVHGTVAQELHLRRTGE